jgi:very-short-patch-repair endonuclease
MIIFYIIIGIVLVVAIALAISRKGSVEIAEKTKYRYNRKNFFLTRAEHECYDTLMLAVGNDYYVFAQVHLPTIVDHKINGQNWLGAFSHINGKSVDFVLCDKSYIAPKLAIELDDRTHERSDRIDRDREVERILRSAGVPLLRLDNHGKFDPVDLAQKIKVAIDNVV